MNIIFYLGNIHEICNKLIKNNISINKFFNIFNYDIEYYIKKSFIETYYRIKKNNLLLISRVILLSNLKKYKKYYLIKNDIMKYL